MRHQPPDPRGAEVLERPRAAVLVDGLEPGHVALLAEIVRFEHFEASVFERLYNILGVEEVREAVAEEDAFLGFLVDLQGRQNGAGRKEPGRRRGRKEVIKVRGGNGGRESEEVVRGAGNGR